MSGGDPLSFLSSALADRTRRARLAQCYAVHTPHLLRYARSLLRRQDWAEDVVQETWTRCITHADTFFAIPPDQQRPWLLVLVRNVALNLLKKENRYTDLDESWLTPAPEIGDPSDIISIIRTMPDRYRTVLELRFVLEWKHREIAGFLGLPESTVSSRLSRGQQLLQDALRKEGYHD